MAITLDIIADKVFGDVGGGYNKGEVDDFLNEILDEMENRENETRSLKEQIARLQHQLEEAQAAAEKAAKAPAAPAAAAGSGKYAAESFELVLSKAKGVYEEIVGDADKKAEEIVSKANEDAANIRAQAEARITDLSDRYESLRQQSRSYYDGLKKLLDEQNVSLEGLKKLLG